ncbi:MAG TPA: ABC-2 family transporter protein [Candidatus Paceibacterota bacterium]|nr:ABC-2 family transporter protein [Candidatus Paceibacterota bacterium]
MLKEIRFALYTIQKNIQSSAELRTSFLMNVIGMAVNNTAFIFLWVFFVHSVGVIGGWTAADIIGLQGFSGLAYGAVFSLAGGLGKLPEYTTSGTFDSFLLSPKNLLLRVATSSFRASAVGDMAFGVVCLVIYVVLIHASLLQIGIMFLLALLASAVFLAMVIAVFSASFFFIDAYSVTNGLFELFLTPSLFHGGAFQGVMRFIFTFLIPSLLIGALPVEAMRHIQFWKLGLIAVLAFAWLFLAIKIFHKAIRKYESSNFMTFGS